MRKYLISPKEDECRFKNLFIVNAENKNQALDIFADFYALKDEHFVESIHDKCVNMSFAEKFWELDEDFCRTGKSSITDEKFKENVMNWFSEKPEFGQLFIEHYFMHFDDPKLVNYKFPDEMIKFAWRKDIDWLDLKIIALDEIEKVNPILDTNKSRSFNL